MGIGMTTVRGAREWIYTKKGPGGLELNRFGRGVKSIVNYVDRALSLAVAGTNKVSAAGFTKTLDITSLNMVAIDGNRDISVNELTVGLFKQVMDAEIKGMGKYEITDYGHHNVYELKAILANPSKQKDVLTYVSKKDEDEFYARAKLLGYNYRRPTEEEFILMHDLLLGNNWTRVTTKDGTVVLRNLVNDNRGNNNPEYRYYYFAIRLVEDKK